MLGIFKFKGSPCYSFRSGKSLTLSPTKRRSFVIEGVLFRTSLTWNNLPQHITGLCKYKIKTSKYIFTQLVSIELFQKNC